MTQHPPDATPAETPAGDASTRPLDPARRQALAEWSDPEFPAGYVRREEVGRGGMGVVYRATETALTRDVAVKLLLDKYPTGGGIARRFLEEAQIAASLQHPNIPPVYRVGALPNDRPYMVMKLIKGPHKGQPPPTLGDLLRDRKDLAQDRLQFMRIFWQVCQAVGYAHERNVIHRDLKPSNVMVGAFGEVQVMDWGLGKVLSGGPGPAADDHPRTHIHDPRGADDPGTVAGVAQGTLAYMPPEQALGKADRIGAPSDVFGLGAILCVILTGLPPYAGANAYHRALAWDTDEAFERLDGCGADADLVGLTKRCLGRDPKDRPASGGEVAAAVVRWRESVDRQAERAALGEHTRHLYLLALEGFDRLAGELHAGLARRPDTLDLQEHVLRAARDGLGRLLGEAERVGAPDRARLCTHLRLGGVELALGCAEAADRAYQAANDLAQRLFDPAPPGGRGAPAGGAPAGLRLSVDPQARRDLGASFTGLGDAARALGRGRDAQRCYARARELAQQVADDAPGDRPAWRELAACLERLGDTALSLHGVDEAWDHYRQAHDVRVRLADAHPDDPHARQDLIVGLNRWGDVATQFGRADEGRDLYEQAKEVQQRPASPDPGDAPARRNLAASLVRLGDAALRHGRADEARGLFEQALDAARRLAAEDPDDAPARHDLAAGLERLGRVALRQGRLDDARGLFEQELDVWLPAAAGADGADDVPAQRALSVCLDRLGEVALRQGRAAAARELFERNLGAVRRRAEAAPGDDQAQRDLLVNYYKLGTAAQAQQDPAGALGWYRQAVAVADRFPHPRFFAADVAIVERGIAACREAAAGI